LLHNTKEGTNQVVSVKKKGSMRGPAKRERPLNAHTSRLISVSKGREKREKENHAGGGEEGPRRTAL